MPNTTANAPHKLPKSAPPSHFEHTPWLSIVYESSMQAIHIGPPYPVSHCRKGYSVPFVVPLLFLLATKVRLHTDTERLLSTESTTKGQQRVSAAWVAFVAAEKARLQSTNTAASLRGRQYPGLAESSWINAWFLKEQSDAKIDSTYAAHNGHLILPTDNHDGFFHALFEKK